MFRIIKLFLTLSIHSMCSKMALNDGSIQCVNYTKYKIAKTHQQIPCEAEIVFLVSS